MIRSSLKPSGLARVIATRREPEHVAQLLGAAKALRHQIGTSIKAWDQPAYERGVATVRGALSPEAFAAAWAARATMPRAVVIAEALADAAPTASPSESLEIPDPAITAELTVREGGVLRLLTEGVSDREIAAAVVAVRHGLA